MSESRTGERSKRALANVARKAKAEPPKNTKRRSAASSSEQPAKKAKPAKPAADAAFEKIRALCLALPEATLTMPWGSPHFRVNDKIFCGFGEKDGKLVLSVKLTIEHARRAVEQSRFWPSPYVGKHGWVSLDLSQRKSWDEVGKLVRESYELIAPQALLARLRSVR